MILTPRHLAVQVVTLASATLSCTYYGLQAPNVLVTLAGFAINPVAIGLGLTAFALDVLKPEMLRIAGTAGLGGARRIAAGAVFAVLFVASMIAVDGMMMKLRSDWAAGRGNAIQAHKDATADERRLEAELAALGITRPVDAIQADVQAAKIDSWLWKRSKQCSDVTAPESKEACKPILELYKERGAAARKAELEPQLGAARAKLAAIEPPKSADPQAEALAKASGRDVEVISYLLVAIIGFGVEIVACLGLWLLSRPRPAASAAGQGRTTGKAEGPAHGLERLTAAILAAGGKLRAENRDVAALLGVTEGCASKWRKGWRTAGEIVEGKADGRLVVELGRKRLKAVA
jgi:hypothetical protein